MQLLDDVLAGATDSNKFRTTMPGTVWLWLHGATATIGSGVTVQCSTSEGGTYEVYAPEGTATNITAEGTYVYNMPGGLYWKVVGVAATAALIIHIDGAHYEILPSATYA
jgi:hypothetical protein